MTTITTASPALTNANGSNSAQIGAPMAELSADELVRRAELSKRLMGAFGEALEFRTVTVSAGEVVHRPMICPLNLRRLPQVEIGLSPASWLC